MAVIQIIKLWTVNCRLFFIFWVLTSEDWFHLVNFQIAGAIIITRINRLLLPRRGPLHRSQQILVNYLCGLQRSVVGLHLHVIIE